MPIYTYNCKEHGEFEKLRRLDEASRSAQCPECCKQCIPILTCHAKTPDKWTV